MDRRWAAYLLYDLLLILAGVLLLPFGIYRALRSPDFRRSLPGRLGFAPKLDPAAGRILLHGVSVGEVKALKPLVAALRADDPARPLAISSSTPTGLATACSLFPDLQVVAYPLDLPGTCRRFLRRVKPQLVILAELEIWPNFLASCARLDVEVAIVNGRITERSLAGYRRVQKWLPQFERIALYGVQNERYAERFSGLDVPSDRVVVTGNLKYENLPTTVEDVQYQASSWARWAEGPAVVVWASTHEPEELDLWRLWAAQPGSQEAALVLVPRHPRRCGQLIPQLRKAVPGRIVRTLSEDGDLERLEPGSLLVVDAFGHLESIYRMASMAFVGGSLIPHGGQNMLEPAVFGVPVVVGPHTENFLEEVAVLREGEGLVGAKDAQEVVECLLSWLEQPETARRIGRNGAEALESQRGAAQSTVLALHEAGLL